MEVTKRVLNIMKDLELQKKLAYINVDEEYNNRVSKEAKKQFKDMEECLKLSGDPNSEIQIRRSHHHDWIGPSTQ